MLPIAITVAILTCIFALIMLSNFNVFDGVFAAALCVWSCFIIFAHIPPSGYLITLMIYFCLGGLMNFFKAEKTKNGTHIIGGLFFLGMAIWAAALYF